MDKIDILRAWMRREGMDGFIIPSGDNHFNEYTQRYFACREWISCFSGSAGTVVITLEQAALWTDSRYFVQAAEQIEGTGIELMKMKIAGTPSITEWLKSILPAGAKVGLDATLFSISDYDNLKEELLPLSLSISDDPFNVVWEDRPPVKFEKIRRVPAEIAGVGTEEKRALLKSKLSINSGEKFAYILSTCDDIAWLCNIRGEDIAYNPLAMSFAVITDKAVELFVGSGAVADELSDELAGEGIVLREYCEFENYIKTLDRDYTIFLTPGKVALKYYNLIAERVGNIVYDTIPGGVVASLKAVKNDIEIEGFRKAMVMDGVAWVKLWMFLERELESGSDVVTESKLAACLIRFRSECKEYQGESFSPIVAYGKNGALPHYSPKGEVTISRDNLLLIDSGAQYLYGTTDTTRTFAIGNITAEQRRDYTSVLKGMIALSRAVFPKGTRGSALDMLARGPICSAGKLYLHGTGHGVGHNLCVHEGPQSIRMEDNPVAFMPGMVTSNEPAIYVEGEYGIRIENLILCVLKESNSFGDFYGFETLTYVPIDKSVIDKELLGSDSLEWLNRYHSEVYCKLSPFLSEQERGWLAGKCSDLR